MPVWRRQYQICDIIISSPPAKIASKCGVAMKLIIIRRSEESIEISRNDETYEAREANKILCELLISIGILAKGSKQAKLCLCCGRGNDAKWRYYL